MIQKTSLDAYYKLFKENKISKLQFETLGHIIKYPNCTQNAIRDSLSETHRKRCAELEQMGLAISSNGKKHKTYRVSGNTQPILPFKTMPISMKYNILLETIKTIHKQAGFNLFAKHDIEKCLLRIGVNL